MFDFKSDKKVNKYMYNHSPNQIIFSFLLYTTIFISIVYLFFTIYPDSNLNNASTYFEEKTIQLGREYAKGQRILYIINFLVQFVFLSWVISNKRGSFLTIKNTLGNKKNFLLLMFSILIILKILTLPFDFLGSYVWQHSWGFSTQNLASWWIDYFKTVLIDLGFTLAALSFVIAILNKWKRNWWIIGTICMSAWLIIQTALWPVLIAPLYNNFSTETDKDVIMIIQEISQRAELEINQILVMDASQRTLKANAYFAGFGSTKRIVLYDTLKKNYPINEIKAVIAHEVAHWKKGHIIQGLAFGILGSAILWRILYSILNKENSYQKSPVVTCTLILWFFMSTSFTSSPLQNYISRSMETEADRYAVELTRDIDSAIQLQIDLATKNLSDINPPAFIEWFSYSHPSALRRIENLKKLSL